MDWYVGCEVLDRIQLLVYIKSTDNNWCQFWFDGQEAQFFWRLRNDCLIMYSFHPEKINAASEHCFNFGISHGTIVYNLCSIILTMNSSIIWLLVDIYIYIHQHMLLIQVPLLPLPSLLQLVIPQRKLLPQRSLLVSAICSQCSFTHQKRIYNFFLRSNQFQWLMVTTSLTHWGPATPQNIKSLRF